MRQLFFIIIFSLLISCKNYKEKIQGIWVSSYFQHIDGGKKSPIAAKKVIEFVNDSIYIKGVKSSPNSDYKGKYITRGKEIIIEDTITFHLSRTSKDSLVFKDNKHTIWSVYL